MRDDHVPDAEIEGWKSIALHVGRSLRWCLEHRQELPVGYIGRTPYTTLRRIREWKESQIPDGKRVRLSVGS